ncbi:TonB-dependent receptor [uncultured Polaribacter sp.]|uniref:TonB-dependent receptor n=1 Tax=uncultured Polaribacter sp. TaxID=174711 RepID=UPI002632AF8F|nr:TonB-dependent receptor [uncultured Polaribacter sp.]
MKKIIFLWLCFGVMSISHSQTLTIKDQKTNIPLELVTLISKTPNSFAITNANGQANILAFKGAEMIEIRTLGYKTVVTNYAELQSSNFEILMESFNLNLNEVVVSGTRWNQISDNVPSKITSISSKEIAFQNPQTAADLLEVSGRVYIQKSQQGGGSPMIRGFATNRLLYTLDGVRMNTAIFRGGNLQNVINMDPFAIENTEILFGPGSVIYGSDAIGGVMSFKTLTPQLSLSEQPLVSGKGITRYSSSNNEKTGHFDVNVGWKKWAFVTSFSTWDFDHLKQGSHGPVDYIKNYYVQQQNNADQVVTQEDPLLQIPSAYSQMNIMQKLRYVPNESWDFQYGFHYSETSPYGRYDRHNRIRNGTARYAEWSYGPQKWTMNHFSLNHKGENKLYDQATFRLAYQKFGESRIDRSLNKTKRRNNMEEVQAYSVNLDFIKTISLKNTLFYGFEYVLNDVDSEGMQTDISTNISTKGASRYPNAQWSSLAVYLNDTFEVSEQFTLQAGLRYNHFTLDADFANNLDFYPFPFKTASLSNGALTGSLGGVFRPAEDWVLNANFGTAFRSPNVDDIGKVFDSEPGSVTVPNPNLEAEYAYNWDLGIAKVFSDAVKLDITAYYTLLKNALVRRDFKLNGQVEIMYDGQLSKVQAMQNAAKAKVYGVQLGLAVKLPSGFSFSSDVNYQKGEEELDDGITSSSRHAAPFFGVSRLTFKAQKIKLQFYSTYQGERKFEDLAVSEQSKDEIYAKDLNGNNYSPSWYTLNLKALYNLSETFVINAGIENMTDQRYRPYSSGISASGRNFIMSLQANF